MPAAADDDHVVGRLRLRIAPRPLPVAVIAEGVPDELRMEYFVIRWHSVAWQRRRRSGRPPRFPWRPTVVEATTQFSAGTISLLLAAMRVLDAGGNAVDAGVTATMALSVLQPDIVSFAGVAPTLVYLKAEDRVVCSRASATGRRRPTSPGSRRRRQERARGLPAPGASRRAGDAHRGAAALRHARFEQAVTPAYELARDPFSFIRSCAAQLEIHAAEIDRYEETPPSSVRAAAPPRWATGSRRPSRAHPRAHDRGRAQRTGRPRGGTVGRARLLYKGSIADDIAAYHREARGFMTKEDLAGFEAPVEPSISVRYRGLRSTAAMSGARATLLVRR